MYKWLVIEDETSPPFLGLATSIFTNFYKIDPTETVPGLSKQDTFGGRHDFHFSLLEILSKFWSKLIFIE